MNLYFMSERMNNMIQTHRKNGDLCDIYLKVDMTQFIIKTSMEN